MPKISPPEQSENSQSDPRSELAELLTWWNHARQIAAAWHPTKPYADARGYEVEDYAAEGFLAARRALLTAPTPEEPTYRHRYIRRIVVQRVVDMARRHGTAGKIECEDAFSEELYSAPASVEQNLLLSRLCARVPDPYLEILMRVAEVGGAPGDACPEDVHPRTWQRRVKRAREIARQAI